MAEQHSETETRNDVLILRDALRDLLALLDLDAVRVSGEPDGGERPIRLAPLTLDQARRLVAVLNSHPDTHPTGLRIGSLVWDPMTRLVCEVASGGPRRVRLRALINGAEWLADPTGLLPARLCEIDAVRGVPR